MSSSSSDTCTESDAHEALEAVRPLGRPREQGAGADHDEGLSAVQEIGLGVRVDARERPERRKNALDLTQPRRVRGEQGRRC